MRFFVGLCFLFVTAEAYGQETGLSFLRLGLSAREQSMGNTGSSSATDAAANYYNPALLTEAAQSSVLLSQNLWLFDTYASYAAANFKSEKSAWGIALSWVTVTDIPIRTRPTEDPDGFFNSQNAAFAVSYAKAFGKKVSVALTGKYLYEKIFINESGGWAADISLAWKPIEKPLMLSAVFQNMGSMGRLLQESSTLPTLFRAGAAFPFELQSLGATLLVESNVVKLFSGSTNVSLGGEFIFRNQLWLRTGYLFGNASRNFSAGVGVKYSAFRFDYAFVPFGNELGSANVLTLQVQY
jgi:hypothetical protein